MGYLILIAIIICTGFEIYFSNRIKRTAENDADIRQNKDKEYFAEKGRNLATKEDIEEITRSLEQVKSEISFNNSWKQEHIKLREERLITILRLANQISMTLNKIITMSKNPALINKLFNLINELNDAQAEITTTGNLLLLDYHKIDNLTPATKLIDNAGKYSMELACLANNVALSLQIMEEYKKKEDSEGITKTGFIINAFITQELKYKKIMEDSINNYIVWLEKLYSKDSIFKYDYKEIDLGNKENNHETKN